MGQVLEPPNQYCDSVLSFSKLYLKGVKYLVLSDVHADIAALERVLEHAGRRGWDAVVSLGDTVGYGAEANAALDRLQALEPYVSLRGNHEAVLLQLLAEPALRVPPNLRNDAGASARHFQKPTACLPNRRC